MAAASYQHSSYLGRASRRSRAVAWSLAVGLALGLVLVLLKLGALGDRKPIDDHRLATFAVLPPAQVESTNRKVAKVSPAPRHAVTPPPAKAPPPVPPVKMPPNMIVMSRQDFAAADIGTMTKQPGDGAQTADSGADSGSVYGPGDGPGGKRLFNAEWYREPSHAELVTYLPPRQQVGWGMIACQTIDRFHVDNCRELGESPGSGIARALRQAAWQFLVRPPRIDGKPQVGAWVRIKFDLVQGAVK